MPRASPTRSSPAAMPPSMAARSRFRRERATIKPQTRYTILTAAGGVTGAFADVTSNLAFLDPSLSYDADNVYLRLARNDISFADIGETANQIAVAAATERLGWGNPLFSRPS